MPFVQGTRDGDEDVITPVVENASNPVFKHSVDLRVVEPDSWARVCGPSAALVFRVWSRSQHYPWDVPRAGLPEDSGIVTNGGCRYDGVMEERRKERAVSEEVAMLVPATPQLGDKLIGSAVVGLDILRGAISLSHNGPVKGMREIDGWYHVLDELQRPHGQIKVEKSASRPSRFVGCPALIPSASCGRGRQGECCFSFTLYPPHHLLLISNTPTSRIRITHTAHGTRMLSIK